MSQTPAVTPAEASEAPEAREAQRAPRWWQRAVPVTAAAVVAGAAFVALAPSDEVRASTTREGQQYVELSLANLPDEICGPRRAALAFQVVSHLDDEAPLRWSVGIDPDGPRPERVRDRGEVVAPEGKTVVTRTRAAAPRNKGYDVTLRLADRPELLRIHCGGGR